MSDDTETKPKTTKLRKPVKAKTSKPAKASKPASRQVAHVGGGHASLNARHLKHNAETPTEGTMGKILAPFKGKGTTIGEALEDLEMTFTPLRSELFKRDQRKFFLSYISRALRMGILTRVG